MRKGASENFMIKKEKSDCMRKTSRRKLIISSVVSGGSIWYFFHLYVFNSSVSMAILHLCDDICDVFGDFIHFPDCAILIGQMDKSF